MLPLKIRADLNVNHGSRKLVLTAVEPEKPQHLGLKLAAYLLFWDEELTVQPSLNHHALTGQPFRPDLLGTDITGSVGIWVECGNTSQNKIQKVLKRWSDARVVVLKERPAEAERFRKVLEDGVPKSGRVEILAWPEGGFKEWMRLLSEKTEIIGEAGGLTLNLVVNEEVCVADLKKY